MATTWAALSTDASSGGVVATSTSGTETIAYDAGATVGIQIRNQGSLIIIAEAVTAGATLVSGSLICYYYNGYTGRWTRYPDLDLSLGSSTYQGWCFSGPSPGVGIPLIGKRGNDRLAWVPSGVTISAGNAYVYHLVA